MSQSPLNASKTNNTDRYLQGWKALNRLLHEDRSFSGHERHCAFLNCGSGDFATVSAVTGFDLADDGRGLAVGDWDFDGDLDVWVTNRTAPRVRFLRNDWSGQAGFVSFRLRGNGRSTNRDAIGARLELNLAGSNTRRLIKTLHAGEGFLTQSSKWIHFGLGENPVESLTVRWPGGPAETFHQIRPNQHYVIVQGSGVAQRWSPPAERNGPSGIRLVPSDPQMPPPTDSARVVLNSRLPLPSGQYLDAQKRTKRSFGKGPLLINLWATWCQPCLGELAHWSQAETQFRQHGLRVLALNTDQLGETPSEADPPAVLQQLGFAFEWGEASGDLVEDLDLFQQSLLDRWQRLPLPTSFLLDRDGQVAVVYKGPVSVKQLIADVELLDASAAELAQAAVPLPGRWLAPPPRLSPLLVSSQLVDHARVDRAIAYLQDYSDFVAASPNSSARSVEISDLHYVIALLLKEQGRSRDAEEALGQAVQANPDDFRTRAELGQLLWQGRRVAEAAGQFREALRINPGDLGIRRKLGLAYILQKQFAEAASQLEVVLQQAPENPIAHVDLATARLGLGDVAGAVDSYRSALKLKPFVPKAANNLAWILSTHQNSRLRNGSEAVLWAERLAKGTAYRQPQILDTLAAAYAEAGQFEKAIQTITAAEALARKRGDTAAVAKYRQRSELYQRNQPYRE